MPVTLATFQIEMGFNSHTFSLPQKNEKGTALSSLFGKGVNHA